MEIQDHIGRTVELKKPPKRIISLVPSQTELLVDLGLADSIVGITHYCVQPPGLKELKTSVGGTKKVNLNKLRALEPDLILCNKEENTREMVESLQKIAPVHVSDIGTLNEAYDLIRDYGQIFDRIQLANTMVGAIKKKVQTLKELVEKGTRRRVAYFIWNKPIMVAGKDTFIDEMLKLNGFDNVFKMNRYPETDLEELKKLDIELCLLSSEPFPFEEKHVPLFQQVAQEVQIVDGEYFSWYGSRLLKAMDYFKSFHL